MLGKIMCGNTLKLYLQDIVIFLMSMGETMSYSLDS